MPVRPPWLYAVRKTRLAERQSNEAAHWNNEGWWGRVEHTNTSFGVETQVWGDARCLDALDTLHGQPLHLKLNQLLRLEPRGGGVERRGVNTRTQSVSRHMVQSGQFDAARRLRNARWQFILPVTVCRSRLLVPQSIPSEQWRLLETDSSYPPSSFTTTTTALSSTPLCFVFQLTGQRERRQCAGSQAQADTFFWRPSSLSIPVLSIVLCFPFPFLFLSSQLETRASCSRRIIHRFVFNNCL